MDDKAQTIGLQDLLDEVSHDLDDFRRKHASDYGVKNITLWWELQKERLLVRHAPARIVRMTLAARVRGLRRMFRWFTAGLYALLAVQTAVWILTG